MIVFLIGLALLAALNYLVTLTGYAAGFRESISDTGSPLTILVYVLLPLSVYLLYRIAFRWGREDVAGRVAGLVILLAVQLILQYQGAYVYGAAQVRSFVSADRSIQYAVSQALEKYRLDYSAYPPALDKLTSRYLPALNPSHFGREYPLHYALLDCPTTNSSTIWLIWFPGPNRQYDLQDGPELQTALGKLAAGSSSAWFYDRVFDPTNGSASRGDIYRFKNDAIGMGKMATRPRMDK